MPGPEKTKFERNPVERKGETPSRDPNDIEREKLRREGGSEEKREIEREAPAQQGYTEDVNRKE